MPFSGGRSCFRLPAPKLGWKHYQQALQRVCRSAVTGNRCPSVWHRGALCAELSGTQRCPCCHPPPRGSRCLRAAPLTSLSRGWGKNAKGTRLYLPFSGWKGPSCENGSSPSSLKPVQSQSKSSRKCRCSQLDSRRTLAGRSPP